MTCYPLSHLSDESLLRGLIALVAQDRATTTALLAHIAEVDERKLYLPAGYASMFLYCVHELHLSEDAALRRIAAARAARRFPAIFTSVARGELHLTAVSRLAPHLTEGNAPELLGMASGRSTQEIDRLLAERFSRAEVLPWIAQPTTEVVPGRVDDGQVVTESRPGFPPLASGPAGDRRTVTPLSSQSFALQLTLERGTHDKLRRAQELLGHQVPSGDLSQVLDRVLDLAIQQLEKRKFAATTRPRQPGGRPSANPRLIPAHVRRAVMERDGGQCSFVSEAGHRCEARKRLEFDHVVEVARGGEASVAGIRLRCRAHNQYAAERTFGAEFMRCRREAAAEARARAEVEKRANDEQDRDVIAGLRHLGFSAAQARRAAESCRHLAGATLEERFRAALSFSRPRGTFVVCAPAAPTAAPYTP